MGRGRAEAQRPRGSAGSQAPQARSEASNRLGQLGDRRLAGGGGPDGAAWIGEAAKVASRIITSPVS